MDVVEPAGGDTAGSTNPSEAASGAGISRAHFSWILNLPLSPVLSIIVRRSSPRDRLVANSAMPTPAISSFRFIPSIPNPRKPQKVGASRAEGNGDGGVFGDNGTQSPSMERGNFAPPLATINS